MTSAASAPSQRWDAAGRAAGSTDARSWFAYAALISTLVAATALRFTGLQSGLWYDEIVTLVLSVRHPLGQIVTEFPGVVAHPLYSVLAHASIAAFGESAWALRLPACLFGIASVAMVYLLGSRLTTRVEAWAGAVVLATSYHHIWFSQDARGYTLLGFLTLLSTYCLVQAARTPLRRYYVVYAIACAAGMYTHLMMAFVVWGHAGVLLAARARRWPAAMDAPIRPFLWACIGSGVLAAIAYVPLLPGLSAYLLAPAPPEAVRVATTSWALGEAVRSFVTGEGVAAAMAAGAFAAIGLVSLWRRQPFAAALLVSPALVTGLVIAVLQHMVRPRFFFFLSGAGAICVGRGVGAVVEVISRRARQASLRAEPGVVIGAVALVAMSAAALPRNYQIPKQDFDGAVQFAHAAERQGARIAAAGPACLPLATYYAETWPCLKSAGDWRSFHAGANQALVVSTLEEYIEDPRLLETLRGNCSTIARFPGTLGGGDLTVCAVR